MELPWYCLATIALIFFVGFVIFTVSNWQKNAFKRTPYHPGLASEFPEDMPLIKEGGQEVLKTCYVVADLETISTPRGKLIVSGLWGWVRHPNYLGDIIMAFCWAALCGRSWVYFATSLWFMLCCTIMGTEYEIGESSSVL